MEKTTVLLLNEHSLMRNILRCMLEGRADLPGLTVLAEAGDGAAALKLVAELRPQLLLTGLTLPDMNAFSLLQCLTEQFPDLVIIAVTHQSEEAGLLPFIAAGGQGYLNKFNSEADLVAAIQCVLKGEIYVSHSGAQLIMSAYRLQTMLAQSEKEKWPGIAAKAAMGIPDVRSIGQVTVLSERERQVLHLYVHGYGNKEIAMLLCLAESTVITYKKRIKEKVLLNKRAELLQYAMTHNLFYSWE